MAPILEIEKMPGALREIESALDMDEISRDLRLMEEFEALVQSSPDHRAEAGLGPLPLNAVALSYEEDDQ